MSGACLGSERSSEPLLGSCSASPTIPFPATRDKLVEHLGISMHLKGFTTTTVFRARCNVAFESLHGIANLEEDIGELLPYLNAHLGGYDYVAISALHDEDEAARVLTWLLCEIEETKDNLDDIETSVRESLTAYLSERHVAL